MKSIITLLLVSVLFPIASFGQYTTFDETVTYINEKISCCASLYPGSEDNKVRAITATSDGILTVSNSNGTSYQIDIMTVPANGQKFIIAHRRAVYFLVDMPKGRYWFFSKRRDAREVGKALEHLKGLCKRS